MKEISPLENGFGSSIGFDSEGQRSKLDIPSP
jgi:hypothetical protein